MTRRLSWSDRALRDAERLPPADRRRLVDALERLAETGHADLKKLAGTDDPAWRLRVGDWRAILDLTQDTITVLRVLNRRDAYR